MRINDGYTEVATNGNGLLIEFRPMLHVERTAVLNAVKHSPATLRRRLLIRHLDEHLIDGPALWSLEKDEFHWAFRKIVGHGTRDQERRDARNVYEGTRLKLLYPHLNSRTCDYCRKWWFDPTTGETFAQDKKPIERTEELLHCQSPVGCPNGTPENQRALSAKNRMAFEFDLHCRAVGRWPDDPIVKRNAYLIGLAAKRVQRDLDERSRTIRQSAGASRRSGVDDLGDFGG